MSEALTLPVGDATTTLLRYPASGAVRLVLAHGAGADQLHPFMVGIAEALAARGVEVVTFNFLYTEAGRKAPDRGPQLEALWREVIAWARGRDGKKLVIGGKSMGGRIASQVAADGIEGVHALLFLGYPLHPPKKPTQLRDVHLPRIAQPMLFVQGERDPFGTATEMGPLVERLPKAELYVVPGGDHSLTVPRRLRPQAEVDAAVQDKIVDWLARLP